jgi:hypothetical protein
VGLRAARRRSRGWRTTAAEVAALPTAIESEKRRGIVRRLAAARVHLIVVSLVLAFVSLHGSFRDVKRTAYFNDESRWINRADFLKEALHPFSIFWEDRYIVRAQPPMGSYIIGLGMLVQGQDLNTNGPWIFEYGFSPDISWNVIGGAMPSKADLFAARRTNAVAGAIAVVALFLLVTHFTNWIGGAAGGLFLALNPLQLYLSSLGVSDELFVCLFALSALAALHFARAPSWPRALLLGLMIGMGTSTKLSPIFVGIALAVGGAALVAQPLINRIKGVRKVWNWLPGTNAPGSARYGWMLISVPLVGAIFTIMTFPYLWPAPKTRITFLFKYRADEMDSQARIFHSAAIHNRWDAAVHMWRQFQNHYSTTAKYTHYLHGALGSYVDQHGLDVQIAGIGLILLAVILLRRGIMSPAFLVAFVLACEFGVIFMALRIDFQRYYGPILFVFAVGVGVAIGQLWTGARLLACRAIGFHAGRRRADEMAPVG